MADFDWKEKYKSKVTTAETAMKLVKSGDNIFIGTACASRSTWSPRSLSIPPISTMRISSTFLLWATLPMPAKNTAKNSK